MKLYFSFNDNVNNENDVHHRSSVIIKVLPWDLGLKILKTLHG